jgi:hypothetical protein
LLQDPIAKREYFGNSLIQDGLGAPNFATMPTPPAAPAAPPSEGMVQRVVEQEKIRRLVDLLRAADNAGAMEEIMKRGSVVIPALVEALTRHDVDLRRQVWGLLQKLLPPGAEFDPYAPELQRLQQIANLRESWERKAG